MIVAPAEVDRVGLGDRNAVIDGPAKCRRRVGRDLQRRRIDIALVRFQRARDPVHRIVRFGERNRNRAIDRARVDPCRQRIAAPENVLLGNGRVEHQLLGARVSNAGKQVAGGLLDDRHLDIRLISGAGDGGCLDVDVVACETPGSTRFPINNSISAELS